MYVRSYSDSTDWKYEATVHHHRQYCDTQYIQSQKLYLQCQAVILSCWLPGCSFLGSSRCQDFPLTCLVMIDPGQWAEERGVTVLTPARQESEVWGVSVAAAALGEWCTLLSSSTGYFPFWHRGFSNSVKSSRLCRPNGVDYQPASAQDRSCSPCALLGGFDRWCSRAGFWQLRIILRVTVRTVRGHNISG